MAKIERRRQEYLELIQRASAIWTKAELKIMIDAADGDPQFAEMFYGQIAKEMQLREDSSSREAQVIARRLKAEV